MAGTRTTGTRRPATGTPGATPAHRLLSRLHGPLLLRSRGLHTLLHDVLLNRLLDRGQELHVLLGVRVEGQGRQLGIDLLQTIDGGLLP